MGATIALYRFSLAVRSASCASRPPMRKLFPLGSSSVSVWARVRSNGGGHPSQTPQRLALLQRRAT